MMRCPIELNNINIFLISIGDLYVKKNYQSIYFVISFLSKGENEECRIMDHYHLVPSRNITVFYAIPPYDLLT